MNLDAILGALMHDLDIGISVVTWHPEDPMLTSWVYVNEARCAMAGFAREEMLAKPPMDLTTRESMAQLAQMTELLIEHGSFTGESTLLHKTQQAIPVSMHMHLVEHDGTTYVLTEHHDIRRFKETERRLSRAEESARDMLQLIDASKQRLEQNIRDNMSMVVFPLLDQMRVDCPAEKRKLLDLLEDRIRHVTRDLGVNVRDARFTAKLTRRQQLICEMIREGMSSKEIASALGCSASTINNHRDAIRKKLGLSGSSVNLQTFLDSP